MIDEAAWIIYGVAMFGILMVAVGGFAWARFGLLEEWRNLKHSDCRWYSHCSKCCNDWCRHAP